MSLSRPRVWSRHRQPAWPLSINRQHPLSHGLIAAWPFLPAGGNTLYDVGGWGLDGVAVNAPAWTGNSVGIGTLHDGATGAGNARAWKISHQSVMNVSELTLAALAFSPNGVSGSVNQSLANYGTSTAGTWAIFLSQLGSYRYQVRVNNGTARIAVGSSPTTGLHSFILTYKNPKLTGFLDGVQDASETTGGTLDTNQGNFYLGSHPDEHGDKDWQEIILLLILSSRAWTAEEVLAWHAAPWDIFREPSPLLQMADASVGAVNYYTGGMSPSKRALTRGFAW